MSAPAGPPVGILLSDPAGATDPELERRIRAIVSEARRSGVTLIHAGDGPAAARSERALLATVEPPGPWAIVLHRPIGFSATAPVLPRGTDPGWLRVSIELGPDPLPLAGLGTAPLRGDSLRAPPGPAPWGISGPSATEIENLRPQIEALQPSWLRFPFHLLNAPSVAPTIGRWAAQGVGVVASDPFADGLLDGRWLSGSPLDAPVAGRDLEWGATRRRLAPVAQLGYLTASRQRTLPEAALSYVRGTPGVAAVLVRVGGVEDLRFVRGGGRPLEAHERRRIEGAGAEPPRDAATPPSNMTDQ